MCGGTPHEVSSKQQKWLWSCARVNIDADAFIETLKIIIVRPWTASVDFEGRPYVFQQDSSPSHEALKTQERMAENFRLHVIPTRGMENINKDPLMKARSRFRTLIESAKEAKIKKENAQFSYKAAFLFSTYEAC
ncbi:hypothetical protein ACTXT7_000969 [Hymenolepis weldensis]